MPQDKPGYTDTPQIPGQKWRVHDPERPQPPIVTSGTESAPTAVGKPPSDAIVLFDGTDLSEWGSKKDGIPINWKLGNGYMEVVPKAGDIKSKKEFGDCQLHVEWATPAEVLKESQGRGNSGVFMMGRYEIQVLDSYKNPTYADGLAASIYGEFPPLVNACRAPGEWQTYDIIWECPRFDRDKLAKPAYLTLLHNGVLVHNHVELTGPTTHRAVAKYEPHPETGPLALQDHGDLVRYRNIWYRPLTGYDQA